MTIVRLRLPALCIVLLGVSGCDDLSPLDYVAPGADAAIVDAAVMDAPVADGEPARVAACRECIATTCADSYAACAANAKCAANAECLTASDCYRRIDPTKFPDLPACATSCVEKTGLSGVADPAVMLAAEVFVCIIDPGGCAADCRD